MANLLSIAELVWLQLNPSGSDETKIRKEQIIADSKTEYAYQMWLKMMAEKRLNGYVEVPSYLLSEKEFDVVNNEIDITGLKIMRSLDDDTWLRSIGGPGCKCRYVKSSNNLTQLMCGDDSLSDDDKTYYPLGKKIKFPDGAHAKKVTLVYANNGETVDGGIEVDDAIGGMVRRTLVEIYLGKTEKEDVTNNSSSDT